MVKIPKNLLGGPRSQVILMGGLWNRAIIRCQINVRRFIGRSIERRRRKMRAAAESAESTPCRRANYAAID